MATIPAGTYVIDPSHSEVSFTVRHAGIAKVRGTFTEFSGQPQCFLTQAQLVNELALHGFEVDPSFPLRELNRPVGRSLRTNSGPVIFQGLFRCLR